MLENNTSAFYEYKPSKRRADLKIDLEKVSKIKGFLDEDEARRLYLLAGEAARLAPCLEIGSYCGKSAVFGSDAGFSSSDCSISTGPGGHVAQVPPFLRITTTPTAIISPTAIAIFIYGFIIDPFSISDFCCLTSDLTPTLP